VAWPGHLPAQHRRLVPQDEDLHLLPRLGPAEQHYPLQQAYGRAGAPTDKITREMLVDRRSQVNGPIRLFEPHTLS